MLTLLGDYPFRTQHTCKSRDCIEEAQLCDGVKDCKDGSDETVHVCKDLQ